MQQTATDKGGAKTVCVEFQRPRFIQGETALQQGITLAGTAAGPQQRLLTQASFGSGIVSDSSASTSITITRLRFVLHRPCD